MTCQWDGDEPYLVVTEETRITPYRLSDVDDWVELNNAPEIAHDNFMFPKPYPREMAVKTMEKFTTSDAPTIDELKKNGHVHGCPFRVLRHSSGKVIGTISMFHNKEPFITYDEEPAPYPWSHESWALGYNIHPDFTGKGLAKKMIHVLVEWAGSPEGMGLRHVCSRTQRYNERSHHILRSLGFKVVFEEKFAFNKDGIEFGVDDVTFAKELR